MGFSLVLPAAELIVQEGKSSVSPTELGPVAFVLRGERANGDSVN